MLPPALVVLSALSLAQPVDAEHTKVPFRVTADDLFYDAKNKTYRAQGSVLIERGDLVMRAERVTFDEAKQIAVAEGDVVMIREGNVVTCQKIVMELPELGGGLDTFELRIKSGISHAELKRRLTEGGNVHSGNNEIVITGEHIQRTGKRSFEIDGGTFTPCDCGPDSSPSWSIDAADSDIDLDSGAWLYVPVFRIHDVPVMVLPAFYVPLGDRRTGLLVPSVGYTGFRGFEATLPLFLALHESFDATVEGTYYTSRGFSPTLEGRWAPTRNTRGIARGTVLFDDGEFSNGGWGLGRQDGPLVRWAVSAGNETYWDESRLVADIALVGDPRFLGEFGDDFLSRQVEESVSRVTYSNDATGDIRVATGLALRQDLRPQRYPLMSGEELREVPIFSGAVPGSGDIRYRMLELRMDAAPVTVSEALPGLYGEATFAMQGFMAPSSEVARFVRADLRPSMAWPLDVFGALTLTPRASVRMTGWTGRANSQAETLARIAFIGRTELATEISRRFGRLRHRIRPSFHHVIIPGLHQTQTNPFDTNDELDQLARVHQVLGVLETELWNAGQGTRLFGFFASLGHDFGIDDLQGVGTSNLLMTADLNLNRILPRTSVSLGARTSIDVERGTFEELIGTINVRLLPWSSLSVQYGQFGDVVPRSPFVAPEELVPSATIDRSRYLGPDAYNMAINAGDLDVAKWTAYQGMTTSLQVKPWQPLTLGAGASFEFDSPNLASSTPDEQRTNSQLRDIGGFVRWDSSCECWGAQAAISFARDQPGPNFRFTLDLARLGGISSP